MSSDLKAHVVGCVLSVLAVLMLSPPEVVHASASPADSVHFCLLAVQNSAQAGAVFDYEQWQRDHLRPAAKPLGDRNAGEPRTVRMIYFLPNDRPFRQEIVDSMKVRMRRVQAFYAEQMQAHGYGDKTFRFETDAQGEPLVHRVDGQHPRSQYARPSYGVDEISEVFDINANVYIVVSEGRGAWGLGIRIGKSGGIALTGTPGFVVMAHELGHAFGLDHNFRSNEYIMSYGLGQDRLSACAAYFLAVHPYFNPDSSIEETRPSTIELISPTRYPPGVKSVSIRLKVGDLEGLHQVILRDDNIRASMLSACRGLTGEKDTVVEFEYDGVILNPFSPDPLSLFRSF